MAKSPGVFEALKFGTVMKCVHCMKTISPKKSNVDEHLKTVGHKDAVTNMTIEGKIARLKSILMKVENY